jgi:hypothetical protein
MSGGAVEKYRSAKQLSGDLEAIGIALSDVAVRHALVDLAVPRIGYNALFSDLHKALRDNPTYKPFAKRRSGHAPLTVM